MQEVDGLLEVLAHLEPADGQHRDQDLPALERRGDRVHPAPAGDVLVAGRLDVRRARRVGVLGVPGVLVTAPPAAPRRGRPSGRAGARPRAAAGRRSTRSWPGDAVCSWTDAIPNLRASGPALTSTYCMRPYGTTTSERNMMPRRTSRSSARSAYASARTCRGTSHAIHTDEQQRPPPGTPRARPRRRATARSTSSTRTGASTMAVTVSRAPDEPARHRRPGDVGRVERLAGAGDGVGGHGVILPPAQGALGIRRGSLARRLGPLLGRRHPAEPLDDEADDGEHHGTARRDRRPRRRAPRCPARSRSLTSARTWPPYQPASSAPV